MNVAQLNDILLKTFNSSKNQKARLEFATEYRDEPQLVIERPV